MNLELFLRAASAGSSRCFTQVKRPSIRHLPTLTSLFPNSNVVDFSAFAHSRQLISINPDNKEMYPTKKIIRLLKKV